MRLAQSIQYKLSTTQRLTRLVKATEHLQLPDEKDDLLDHLLDEEERLFRELAELEDGTHWVYPQKETV